MSKHQEEWDELADMPPRRVFKIVIITIIVLAIVIPLLSWGWSVLTAPVVGKGEQWKQIHDATNITFQYEHFFTLDADIRSQLRNLESARQEAAAFDKQYAPSATESFTISEQRGQKQANVTGLRQILQQNIATYNNDARTYTKARFLDAKLPDYWNPSVVDDATLVPPTVGGNNR